VSLGITGEQPYARSVATSTRRTSTEFSARTTVFGAFLYKERNQVVVTERAVLLVDDMIIGGTTLARAAEACRRGGIVSVVAATAHGVFVLNASQVLAKAPIDGNRGARSHPLLDLDSSLADLPLDVLDGWRLVLNRFGACALTNRLCNHSRTSSGGILGLSRQPTISNRPLSGVPA